MIERRSWFPEPIKVYVCPGSPGAGCLRQFAGVQGYIAHRIKRHGDMPPQTPSEASDDA